MKLPLDDSRLCVVTDPRLAGGRPLIDIVRDSLIGGARMIQLRDKDAGGADLYRAALDLRALTSEYGALLLVNDRPDVAVAVEADGVHVGQDDLPVAAARRVLGPRRIVGASARTPEEASEALAAGADYLGVGPVFEARGTKPDAAAPQGPELVRRIRAATELPLIAIGGIAVDNAASVIQAGADGIAVVSAVVAASDVIGATSALWDVVARALES